MQETPQIAAKWRRFKQTGCQQTRAELIEHYLPLAKQIAGMKSKRMRYGRVDCYHNFLSAASQGLLEAVDAFELSAGAKFNTFASWRMRGAIADWQRAIDPLTRTQRESGLPSPQSLEAYEGRDSEDNANSRARKPYELPAPCDTVHLVHVSDAANVAISHTTAPKAEALQLHSEGLTNQEIAIRQGISATGVQWRQAEGKREIAASCNRDDFIWE